MPLDQRMYFVAPDTVTDETTGGDARIPKYSNAPEVEGVNASIIEADSTTAKPLNVAEGSEIFLARFRAEASFLDGIEDKEHDLIRVVDPDTGTKTNAETMKKSNFAKYLNEKFRPQSFEELLEQLGDEYRYLSADEWGERLGMTVGF